MQPMWEPSEERVLSTQMNRFRLLVNSQRGLRLSDSRALHQWSLEQPALFWQLAADFVGMRFAHRGSEVLSRDPIISRSLT